MTVQQSTKFALFSLLSLSAGNIFSGQSVAHKKEDVAVSAQKIMTESDTGKAMQARLQAKQQEVAAPLAKEEDKLKAKREELLKLQQDLEKLSKDKSPNSEVISDMQSTLETGARKFERDMQALQAKGKEAEQKMQTAYQAEMNKFDALVKETIKELAIKNDWGMVFMQEQLLYVNPSKDKTNEVIAALDVKAKAAAQIKKQELEKQQAKPNPKK